MAIDSHLSQTCSRVLLFAALLALPLRLAADEGTKPTLSGKVTDENGKPIAGAHVRVGVAHRFRECITGADGVYRLEGDGGRRLKVVVFAAGRALDMREIAPEPDMGPIDFRLKPGGKIRLRVADENDTLLPGARLIFRSCGGSQAEFAFDHLHIVGNEQGIWEWREAP